jgi:hypothetical protein
MAMRSTEQIDKIKQRIQDPFCVKNFLNDADVQYLVDMFELNNNKIYKNTGPVTLDIKDHLSDSTIKKILNDLSFNCMVGVSPPTLNTLYFSLSVFIGLSLFQFIL